MNAKTVNGQTAYRHGEYFRSEVPVNNSSSAQWQGVTVSASDQASVSGNEFVPETPEAFTYDADGNLKSDGRFNYYWDGENRLTNITSLASDPTGSKVKVDFVYDWQGRRIQKTVWTNNGSAYVPEYTNNFVYDGWNLLAILNPQSSILSSFTWGNDLSGSQQGAGGVGGLLEVSEISNSQITNFFVAYDGNGNVAALVNAADGTVSANYEYGPFGELIRQTGPMAQANPFRFSTKYQDDESDLLYYGYRYYKPSTGAWTSRDPLEEEGGMNLYNFVANSPLNRVDALGRLSLDYNTSDGFSVTAWGRKLTLGQNGGPFSFEAPLANLNFGTVFDVESHGYVKGNVSILSIPQRQCKNSYFPTMFDETYTYGIWPPSLSLVSVGSLGSVATEEGEVTVTAGLPASEVEGTLKYSNNVLYWGKKPCSCAKISLVAEDTLSGRANDEDLAAVAVAVVGLISRVAAGGAIIVLAAE